MPRAGECDYTQTIDFDLGSVRPSLAGPKRPQDRIDLAKMGETFRKLLGEAPPTGYGKPAEERNAKHKVRLERPMPAAVAGGGSQNGLTQIRMNQVEMVDNRPTPDAVPTAATDGHVDCDVAHGDVVIAAITSCTNTSNPSVMLAAGLLAKKAVDRG